VSRASIKEWIRPYYLRWIYFPLFPQARPRYFEDAWRYPRAKAGKRAGDGRQFLFLPMTDWHTRIQRSQHLALSLAKLGHESVYLNPHLGREYPHPWRWGEAPVVCELAPGVSELHVHLPLEPVFHQRMLSASEERRLEQALRETVRGQDRLALVVSLPLWLSAAVKLHESSGATLVYDCHDFLDGFTGMAPEIVAKEAELLELCDVAVFSSAHLMQQMVARRPALEAKSVLIRNGVDSAHFRGAAPGARDGQVIGYAGALEEWFDADLIERAAQAHPEWRFVLIGRVEDPSIHRLSALPNVQLRGEVPYADLPRHLAEFTVGVIPFAVNELTLAADPIKLYEYFSLGLPVVSTALPEVERHGDLVYVADRQSFVGQLETAVSERDEPRQRRRMALADAESWSQRAAALIAAVEAADRR
jgi:glycosyltransferase involved in cell wall biosynthesis